MWLRLQRIRPWLFVVALYLIGMYIFFRPSIDSGFTASQTGIGDTLFNNYILEHSFTYFFNSSDNIHLWSPNFFYPTQNVLAYSENLLGVAPFYWLLRVFFEPLTSFQVWMMLLVSIGFFSIVSIFKSLGLRLPFATAASFLYTFGMPRLMQLGHQQLLSGFIGLFCLFFLWRALEKNSNTYFRLSLLFFLWQLVAGIYLGLMLGIVYILLLLVSYRWYGQEIRTLFFKPLHLFLLVATIIVSVLFMQPYAAARSSVGFRPFSEVASMLPTVTSYFNTPSSALFSPLYPSIIQARTSTLPMRQEHYLSFGFCFYILMTAVFFVTLKKRVHLLAGAPTFFYISLIIFLVLSLITIKLPSTSSSLWWFFYKLVPGADAIRAVTRFFLFSSFFLLFLVFWLVQKMYSHGGRIAKALLLLLIIFTGVEQVVIRPFAFSKAQQLQYQVQTTQIVTEDHKKNAFTFFYLRWPEEQNYLLFQIKAMWTALESGIPTLNGYSGNVPPGYAPFIKPLTNEAIIAWIEQNLKGQSSTTVRIFELDNRNNSIVLKSALTLKP